MTDIELQTAKKHARKALKLIKKVNAAFIKLNAELRYKEKKAA